MITMQVGECQIKIWNAASSSLSFYGMEDFRNYDFTELWILGIMGIGSLRNRDASPSFWRAKILFGRHITHHQIDTLSTMVLTWKKMIN